MENIFYIFKTNNKLNSIFWSKHNSNNQFWHYHSVRLKKIHKIDPNFAEIRFKMTKKLHFEVFENQSMYNSKIEKITSTSKAIFDAPTTFLLEKYTI